MDRKSWIVVTLCVILMGVNFHYMQENQKLEQAEAARKKQEELAKKPAANSTPAANATAAGSTPALGTGTGTGTGTTPPAAPAAPVLPEETHSLKVGTVTYELTTKGGGIARAALAGTDRVVLNKDGLEAIGALRREPAGLDAIPYKLTAKSDKSATFEGTTAEGVVVTKTYSLSEGDKSDEHLVNLEITLKNTGTAQHRSEEYYLYAGAATALKHDEARYDGFFWNNAGDTGYELSKYYNKGFFSDAPTEYRQPYNALQFSGVMTRFYTHILTRMAKKHAPAKFWSGRRKLAQPIDAANIGKSGIDDYTYDASMGLPTVDLAPGASVTESYQIYLGPKEYDRLNHIGEQRSQAMFYGFFKYVSIALSKVMRWMHDLSGSWGLAVILLTIFVRLCLWPIHAKSTMTMKRMGLLGPKMKELQEKYKDNPQQQQMEVMKLYKDYGVNPLGGCLPLLLQFPIFIGLYSVLEVAAELRGQSFWWVRDLAAADTQGNVWGFNINPLPLIMGLTMVAQMKLTPQPATVDKTQQRIFMMMPLFFLWISYDFAAALALYWSTQNIFSIFQTRIMKLYMPEPKLEKVSQKPAAKAAPSQSAFFNAGTPSSEKKKGPKPPRLGG
ncbi:YidC/Oxa1 family insertase periplasmic-domain containing protein [Prosthecobacter sp.]|uniref:YidC/Oxa1 family insertase periplasmic-domain containing protein n=1 Tax=Prosthecobacter sp. TaxID=1965333 RepID=UPI0037847D78